MVKISFQDFEILIVAAVQSNALLFAFGGKFKLNQNQPIRGLASNLSRGKNGRRKKARDLLRGTDLLPDQSKWKMTNYVNGLAGLASSLSRGKNGRRKKARET